MCDISLDSGRRAEHFDTPHLGLGPRVWPGHGQVPNPGMRWPKSYIVGLRTSSWAFWCPTLGSRASGLARPRPSPEPGHEVTQVIYRWTQDIELSIMIPHTWISGLGSGQATTSSRTRDPRPKYRVSKCSARCPKSIDIWLGLLCPRARYLAVAWPDPRPET